MGKWLYAFVVTLFSLAANLMLRMTSKRLPGFKCKCGHWDIRHDCYVGGCIACGPACPKLDPTNLITFEQGKAKMAKLRPKDTARSGMLY